MREFRTEADCRLLYADIINGYSLDSSGKFFLKHVTEKDNALTEQRRVQVYERALKQGILSEKEKLELLNRFGHWTAEEEAAYQEFLEVIEGMRASRQKLIIPQQIAHLEGLIAKKQAEHQEKIHARYQLLGMTREEYARKKAAEFHILFSFVKDGDLSSPLFSQEEMDDLSPEELEKFMKIYQEVHEVFTEKTFKRVAVCPFFLNSYMVSQGNPFYFFGKPIVLLTVYQLALFNRGSYYKNILEESSQRPPEEFYNDLDKIIQFYDKQMSIIIGKRTNNQIMQ